MKMKKLVTLSLAALMVLSLSVTAFAAPSPGPATDAQVTPISVSPATDEDGLWQHCRRFCLCIPARLLG